MHTITIQRRVPKGTSPASGLLKNWAKTALTTVSRLAADPPRAINTLMAETGNTVRPAEHPRLIDTPVEVNIRIVSTAEMTILNERYRHKKGATNVLSFPFDMPAEASEVLSTLLGDIVICADIVNQEALTQGKTAEAHWAHIVVHGILHLAGYDHETDADAALMEPQEIRILAALGFNNPYELTVKGTSQ